MDALIRQIAREFNNGLDDSPEALGKALRTVAFSGLNRSGFFREFFYIPELDRPEDRNSYSCFLYPGKEEDFDADRYLSVLRDELSAFGVNAVTEKLKSGFRIEMTPEDGGEPLSLEIFICCREIRDLRIRISYVPAPMPYELRSVSDLKEKQILELRKAFEKGIKTENVAQKKKKGSSKKTPNKKKQADPQEEQWIQPSLFNFG